MTQSRLTNQYVEPVIDGPVEDYKLGICTYPNYYGEIFDAISLVTYMTMMFQCWLMKHMVHTLI